MNIRDAFPSGTRVRLRYAVDRFPDFIAPPGATGSVCHDGDETWVVLDERLPGAEHWDNAIQVAPDDCLTTTLEVLDPDEDVCSTCEGTGRNAEGDDICQDCFK